MCRILSLLVLLFGVVLSSRAAELKLVKLKVGNDTRDLLIHEPAAAKGGNPVIFAFHGHGGSMKNAADAFKCHEFWPEAICVYMQGLKTVSKTDPKGERAGWQNVKGTNEDRDLAFFDAVLTQVKKQHSVDEKRIYATGFSNGGGFTFLLWAERGDKFAAVAPCGSIAGRKANDLKPLPCLHIAGKKDDIVDFASQQKSMDAIKTLNGVEATGKPWPGAGKLAFDCTQYRSEKGPPFVSAVHEGGHEVPAGSGRLVVRFFRDNPKP